MWDGLAGVLGGTKEASDADFDLEIYYKQIKRAQRLGGLTGFVNGANTDSQALGVLRKHSAIIGWGPPQNLQPLNPESGFLFGSMRLFKRVQ